MQVDPDAFSSGQIGSKIWLCEELEKLNWSSVTTDIYGGWHGITAFLLLSRGKFKVGKIRSFDIDSSCQPIADMINENWVWRNWKFKSFTKDCNTIIADHGDLIVNTSTEHFNSSSWFDNIPVGTRVVLQGNNMQHSDHCNNFANLQVFKNSFPLSNIFYEGTLDFKYPTWKFTRFMVIGKK